jgi:hypothetical protein
MSMSFSRTATKVAACTILFVLALSSNQIAFAQRNAPDIPVVTGAIAIENARIVQAPGRVIDSGTIVIRDGLIVAVGANVSVPYDAERIDGEGKTVYAAFIDGLSNTGVPTPPSGDNLPPVPDRSNPPNDRAGIQPERDVRDLLSSEEKSIAQMRELGFGASHVVPRGQMLPGSGAIILLTGDNANDMVLAGDVSMFAQFIGARGMYPGTPMAIMSKMRQLHREAERRAQLEAQYSTAPSGATRPDFDAVHYAFFPVLERTKPVMYFVDDALEIHRALTLQEDLGFNLVLAGLNEAFDAVDVLAEAGVPMFLTLDLPEKPEWMSELKADSIQYILDNFDPDERTASYRDLEAERRNLEARSLMSRSQYAGVASDLQDAGLAFGFSTMGVDAKDIRGNIQEMIESGLDTDTALAALTINAARLLGLDASLGTIDTGKIANLIVTDGDIFEKDTHYATVFVDGQKYAFEKKESKHEKDDESTR